MKTWYVYTFEDGHQSICGKMSADELRVMERKYGKLKTKQAI